MYSLKQAAEKLGISAVTLRRYIKQGKLPAKKVGKELRIAEADVEALLANEPLSDPDLIVNEVLETNKRFKWLFEREQELFRAVKIYKERGEEEKARETERDAIIFSFRLVTQSRSERAAENSHGRFSPRLISKDTNGNEVIYPDPALIDSEMVAHAKSRADQIKNPLTNAVYCDLVFEFGAGSEKNEYGRRAFKNYLQAAVELETNEDRVFEVQNDILRALEFALLLKDDAMFSEVVETATKLMEDQTTKGGYRIQFELIRVFLKFTHKLSSDDINRFMKLINACVDFYIHKDKNEHLARGYIELKKQLPNVKSDDRAKKQIQREIFDSYMREGESKQDQGMVAAHFYAEALRAGGGVLKKDEKDALRHRIETANLEGEKNMKMVSHEIKLTREEIKQYVDAFMADDIDDSLKRLVLLPGAIPSVAHAKKVAQDLLERFPVSQMFGHSLMQDGRVIALTGGGTELSENHIYRQLRDEIDIHGWFIGFVFDELVNRGWNAKHLTGFLAERDFFDNDTFAGISEAVELYFEGKYFSFINTIIPQIERLLRLANRKLGKPTLTSLANGEQRVIYLPEALDNLKEFFDAVSPDWYPYYSMVLVDKRGLDMRNAQAHGLLTHDPGNKTQANILMQLLLMLTIFKFELKDTENQD